MAPLCDVSAHPEDTHMSLAEVPNYDDRRTPEFDRTPPQDLVAEQSVLGVANLLIPLLSPQNSRNAARLLALAALLIFTL